MSKLERLSIRGIRNFGVDAEDEQSISFSTPLTLILGKNGSGKTTIIECIKFALTAEMPPKCNKDKSNFIYNPDVLNISESKGMVKLTLKNLLDQEETITREAKVTKKNGKLAFESMGATISDPNSSVGNGIGGASNDICSVMGVSKAIINHVLFCHQEDANWPFGTDKEVQTKFKEILETDKYDEMLKCLKKKGERLEKDNTDKKEVLKELEMNKLHADELIWKISECERELRQMSKQKEDCNGKLKTLDENLKKLDEYKIELSSISTKKIQFGTELKNQQENARNLSSKIKDICTGDDDALKREIESFKVQHTPKQNALEDQKIALQCAESELRDFLKQIEENDRNYHLLLKDHAREQAFHAEKVDYIQKICEKLDINIDFDISNSNDRTSGLVTNIQNILVKANDEIKETIAINSKLDLDIVNNIQKFRSDEIRITSEIGSIVEQMNALENQLDKNKDELKLVEQSDSKLEDIRIKIAKNKQDLERLTETTNTQGVRNEIAMHCDEEQKLSDKLNEIIMMSAISARMIEVRAKENCIKKRQNEIRDVKEKHYENFKILFPDENIEHSFKHRIDIISKELHTEMKLLEAEIHSINNEVQKKENQLQIKKQDQGNLEEELKHLEEEINKECEQKPFDEVLSSTKENVEKYQMEYSALQSSSAFYKNYIKKMQDDPSCPLCHKDMNENEVNDLHMELNDKIEKLPENIARIESSLKQSKIKLEKLLGMQRSVERTDMLISTLIPQVNDGIKRIEAELSEFIRKKIEREQNIEVPKSKVNLIDEIISTGDMRMLDEALLDIQQIQKDLERLRHELPDTEITRNYDLNDLQTERNEILEKTKLLKTEIKRKEKLINDYEQQRHKLKNERIELQGLEIELQRLTLKKDDLTSNIKRLCDEIHKLREKKTKNEESLIPIQEEIKAAEDVRQHNKVEGLEFLAKKTKRYDDLKKNYDCIERVSDELKLLAALNLTEGMEGIMNTLEKLRIKESEKKHLIDKIRKEIQTLKEELSNRVNIERDLNDNLELKKIQKEIDNKKTALANIEMREFEINFIINQQENVDLQNQRHKINLEQENIAGQMNVKQKNLDDLQTEMQQPRYREANDEFKKAKYESIVRTKAIKDLLHYSDAFEKALSKYHSDKISQINEVIRELWRSIYRGNDIDYIQIKTEEEPNCRRKYTYRVVASKNDVLMNFRGQCSAGQRVLACIIIRIALAEIFGGHCGVLALDEPTTNLDIWNIESLCDALIRLVEERSRQNNFMLIVVTHDEEFLRAMGHISNCYRVYRDTNDAHGKSRIEKVDTI